jgi:drug/metabolite transporter (DMT)-like permease
MTRRAWWAFAVMSVTWGASYLLIKIGIEGGMPAADVAWLRVALAAVILIVLARRAGVLATLHGRWPWVIGYAVAEISIPFPLIALGEVHIASSLAAIIIASVPLIVTVLSLRFDPSERPTPMRALGLAVGFVGVIALVGIDVAGSSAEVLGALAVLVGAVGYAIGPMLAPFAAVDLPRRTPTVGAWAAVATLGVFCTAMAFVVYTVLVREAGTGRATIITYVNPLVAVVLGVTLLGERPGPGALAGLVMILAGSWLSTGGRLPPRGPQRPRHRRRDDPDPEPDLQAAQSG